MTNLLAAIRFALWEKDEECLYKADWHTLLVNAQEHAVMGLAFRAMEHYVKQAHDRQVFLQSFAIVEQIRAINRRVNKNLSDFIGFIYGYGIDYRVVKGQVVASCYPDSLIRQSGDIDIWIPKEQQAKCINLIETILKREIKRYGSEIHVEFDWNGTSFEVHQRLTSFVFGSHQNYFKRLLDEDEGMMVNINQTNVKTLSPTLNALYIFIHLFYHLVTEGVGLRQFCDWMMWLHQYKDDINRQKLSLYLNELNLRHAYCVLGAILVCFLGLPAEEFPLQISGKEKRRSKKVLKDVLGLGNFGRKKDVVHEVGILHSIQTFFRMMAQGVKYVDLAPSEVLFYVPQRFFWYYRKLLLKFSKNKNQKE